MMLSIEGGPHYLAQIRGAYIGECDDSQEHSARVEESEFVGIKAVFCEGFHQEYVVCGESLKLRPGIVEGKRL
jgi:hypothetical protein